MAEDPEARLQGGLVATVWKVELPQPAPQYVVVLMVAAYKPKSQCQWHSTSKGGVRTASESST